MDEQPLFQLSYHIFPDSFYPLYSAEHIPDHNAIGWVNISTRKETSPGPKQALAHNSVVARSQQGQVFANLFEEKSDVLDWEGERYLSSLS